MYIIQKRYQYRSNKGIIWTNWFNYDKSSSLKEAKQTIRKCSKTELNPAPLKAEYKILKENNNGNDR